MDYGTMLLLVWLTAIVCSAQEPKRSQFTLRASEEQSVTRFLLRMVKADLQAYPKLRDTRYYAASADLDGDGKPEVILWMIGDYWCGTGGCETLVLTPERAGYRLVATIATTRPPIAMLRERRHGWRTLTAYVAGGGEKGGYVVKLPFNGKTYLDQADERAGRLGANVPKEVLIEGGDTIYDATRLFR